ncbi:hypothetical protein PR048_001441, partial [Dryococelus australis]
MKKNHTIIMGDFKAKVGKDSEDDFIGPYGLGERNERGEQLNSPGIMIRNNIYYILLNQWNRNSHTSVRTYPGAGISSDHNPLVGVFKIRMKNIRKKMAIKYNLGKLKEHPIRNQVEIHLNNEISILSEALSTEEK